MGRPPCCDKTGVKKGPWTPEEDIMLVSYIQEHGPGNWRAVPTSTGLRRCSKSCRLRWTNYLRPGIKRGNFTDHEEKMIIQLQALLGNKWAAIASYLPERTDNDIKNFWNTHLKKKLKKIQSSSETTEEKELSSSQSHSVTKGQWERRLQTNIHTAKQALQDALTMDSPKSTPTKFPDSPYIPDMKLCNSKPSPPPYAANSDNIARLLKGWVKNSPARSPAVVKLEPTSKSCSSTQHSFYGGADCISSGESKSGMDMSEAFESLFGFRTFESSTSEFSPSASPEDAGVFQAESKQGGGRGTGEIPFSVLENWLLDDGGVQNRLDLANFSFFSD